MTDASRVSAADVRMDRMRQLLSGQVLEVVSDDPTARSGLASWSRLTGNPMLAIVEDGPGRTRYYLCRK